MATGQGGWYVMTCFDDSRLVTYVLSVTCPKLDQLVLSRAHHKLDNTVLSGIFFRVLCHPAPQHDKVTV